MSNRIQSELCVGCGNPLLLPFNEFRMCSECTEKIKKVRYETKMHRMKRDTPKVILNVKRDKIWSPTNPLGNDA